MRLLDYPDVTVFNCSPALLRRWRILERNGRIEVPVTHRLPARLMGSGLGKNTVWRGDYDIQLFDSGLRRRFRLDSLRFGDMVAITDADTRFGPSYRRGRITIGIIVHGDSTVSGHGPGITPLLTGASSRIRPVHSPGANLAALFDIRRPTAMPRAHTLVEKQRASSLLRAAVVSPAKREYFVE
jgi:hypothetical protein